MLSCCYYSTFLQRNCRLNSLQVSPSQVPSCTKANIICEWLQNIRGLDLRSAGAAAAILGDLPQRLWQIAGVPLLKVAWSHMAGGQAGRQSFYSRELQPCCSTFSSRPDPADTLPCCLPVGFTNTCQRDASGLSALFGVMQSAQIWCTGSTCRTQLSQQQRLWMPMVVSVVVQQ